MVVITGGAVIGDHAAGENDEWSDRSANVVHTARAEVALTGTDLPVGLRMGQGEVDTILAELDQPRIVQENAVAIESFGEIAGLFVIGPGFAIGDLARPHAGRERPATRFIMGTQAIALTTQKIGQPALRRDVIHR